MKSTKPLIYNPAQKSKEQITSEFLIRKQKFDALFLDIKSAQKNTSGQHYLLAGQRGMGKTTLLLRIKFAIEDDPDLKNLILPIRFSEEQYNIISLENLWEETALLLEQQNEQYAGLCRQMLLYENEKNYERKAFEILEKKLKEYNQKVLLLIDNIGELFDKFPPLQHNRLREILMNCPVVQIIGSSSRVLDYTFDYKKPFFEFFNEIKLEPLDKASAVELLRELGKEYKQEPIIEDIIKNNPARIEVLRRLTGGVPRTIVLLYDIFVDHHTGNAFDDLQHLLDRVNSIYKHRMDELKPQQQQIIDAIARAWEPITPAQILEKTKLYRDDIKSNQISAQLMQLTENQVVEPLEDKGRRKTYRIRERFFNIWYLMRHGRKQHKEEVLWLVKFLEAWCSIKELKNIVHSQLTAMGQGNYSLNAAYYKTKALYSIEHLDSETKLNLLQGTEDFLREKGSLEWSSEIGNDKLELQDQIDVNKVSDLIKSNKIDEAEHFMIDKVNSGRNRFIVTIGEFYSYVKKDVDKAEEFYLKAVELKEVTAMFNLGNLYLNQKRNLQKAEEFYLMAIEKGSVKAMFNLANLYLNEKREIDKAEKYFLKAVDQGDIRSMFNLAHLYLNERKDLEKAEQYYLKGAEKGDANAMLNVANLYRFQKKDIKKAETFYIDAIKNGSQAALYPLGNLYRNSKKDIKKAEQFYLKAIEHNDSRAVFGLAHLYQHEIGDNLKAEQYYLKAIELGDSKSLNNLAIMYAKSSSTHDKAEQLYLKAIEQLDARAMFNLANLYHLGKKDYDKAITYYLKTIKMDDSFYQAYQNLIILYIKGDKTKESFDFADKLFSLDKYYDDLQKVLELFLVLLYKQQHHFLINQFKKEKSLLMKYAHPLYYVLAYFMKDELPGEYEKAGSEIKETVDEIINFLTDKRNIKII